MVPKTFPKIRGVNMARTDRPAGFGGTNDPIHATQAGGGNRERLDVEYE
jgi:hypothetical protein